MRKTFAEINLQHLKHNFLELKSKSQSKKILAVVKADAYGHGMIECAKSLMSLGTNSPDYFGVALLEEGIALRESGITQKNILLFSPFSEEEIEYYQKYKLITTVSSKEHLTQLSKLKLLSKLKVHVNVDTGMGRLGLDYNESEKIIRQIALIDNVLLDGIYTHFACSDSKDKRYTDLQISNFNGLLEKLRNSKINFGVAHAANSAGVINHPNARFDMVRPGIALYGYPPAEYLDRKISLKPVMNLISYISTIRNVKKGESVSYGRKFIAQRDSLVASIPIGYADGIIRNLSNKINVIVNDRLFSQIGRVTMDRIMIDVTDGNVKINDKVILLGNSVHQRIDAWDWSKILKTIPYEITCNISKRVPRFYIEE